MSQIVLSYLQVFVWPIVVVVAVFALREPLMRMFPGSRMSINLFGVRVETTIPELVRTMEEEVGRFLSTQERDFLRNMKLVGFTYYSDDLDRSSTDQLRELPYKEEAIVAKKDVGWLRRLRNAGLVMTEPRGSSMNQAQGLRLTALGRIVADSL